MVVKVQAPLLLSAADKLGATGGEKGDNNWRILHGDSLALLPQLPDASADLIFADPPYNLQLKKALYRPNGTEVEGVNDEWDKFSSFEEYDDFCRKWLTECRRLLSPRGSLWAIGTYHNIFRIGRLMQDAGFWLLNDVIWHKTNPMPNFRGVRFTNATETLLWAKKSEKARCVFNNKLMKAENNGKQMPNVWRIPLCGGKERLRDDDGNKLHSTQKPLELLRRIILSSTAPGDIILDPFMGSGTTMAAALGCGRNCLGIECKKTYTKVSARRIRKIAPAANPPAEPQIPPRVPFEKLVGLGMIRRGCFLYFRKGRKKAKVLKNGKLRLHGWEDGSIHQVGAIVAGSAECNGWMNWYLRKNADFFLINDIRRKYRDKEAKNA